MRLAFYVANARKSIKQKNIALESKIASLTSRIAEKKQQYERAKAVILKNEGLDKHYNLDGLQKEENDLRIELAKLTDQRSHSKDSIASYERYLKLLEATPVILGKIREMEVRDALLKIFFLTSQSCLLQTVLLRGQLWPIT